MERNVRVSILPIPDIPQTGETASSSRVVYCVKEEQWKGQWLGILNFIIVVDIKIISVTVRSSSPQTRHRLLVGNIPARLIFSRMLYQYCVHFAGCVD